MTHECSNSRTYLLATEYGKWCQMLVPFLIAISTIDYDVVVRYLSFLLFCFYIIQIPLLLTLNVVKVLFLLFYLYILFCF